MKGSEDWPEGFRWTFGGGTALAVHYDHRISYDIDAFVTSADIVSALAPNQNPVVKRLIGNSKYEFPGNYLKLVFDAGEIDFIVGGRRTDRAAAPWDFEDRSILLENPWEIGIKKLFYRPSAFKIRDVFDLAVIMDRHPEELVGSLHKVADRLDRAMDRISLLSSVYGKQVLSDVNPRPGYEAYLRDDTPQRLHAFLVSHRPAAENIADGPAVNLSDLAARTRRSLGIEPDVLPPTPETPDPEPS